MTTIPSSPEQLLRLQNQALKKSHYYCCPIWITGTALKCRLTMYFYMRNITKIDMCAWGDRIWYVYKREKTETQNILQIAACLISLVFFSMHTFNEIFHPNPYRNRNRKPNPNPNPNCQFATSQSWNLSADYQSSHLFPLFWYVSVYERIINVMQLPPPPPRCTYHSAPMFY